MTVGMFGGKFLPFHNGHFQAILAASLDVEKLYVVLCSSPRQDWELCHQSGIDYIDNHIRMNWLGRAFCDFPKISIINVIDDDWNDWENGANKIKAAIPETITHVFSSEPEYDQYFKRDYPHAKHVIIDANRKWVPISASKIRKDPYSNWEFLPGPVKEFFIKKVLITGTESVGKSTLTKKLAEHYDTHFVYEVGRDFCERSKNLLSPIDFSHIACKHYHLQFDETERSKKFLFVDSDAVVTKYYYKMYFPNREIPSILDGIIGEEKYNLVLYLQPDVPWVADGYRFKGDQKERNRLNDMLINMYTHSGFDLKFISGSYEERFDQAISLIDQM
jgi:HTH-type transcriptional repressor of NAD biosynthesis genes